MFFLPKPTPQSPPMFDNPFIDRFSRVHWVTVPALFVPAVAALIYYSFTKTAVTPLQTLGLVAGGWLFWTFIEYVLHRSFFHWEPPGKWGERMHFIVHGVHHNLPNDKLRLVMPPAVSISLFALFLGLFHLVHPEFCWSFMGGFTIGYMFYDLVHYATHHVRKPKMWWFRMVRKNHLKHHGAKPGQAWKFGVSTTLWDHVFRTFK